RGGLTWLLAFLGLMIPVGLFFSRYAPRPIAGPVMWVVYTWLGMAFFLTVFIALSDTLRLAVTLPLKAMGKPIDPDRRRFLALLSGGLVLLSDLGVSAVGFFGATAAALQVKRVRVTLNKLPKALEGYRIVQISDIHIGPILGRDFLAEVVRQMNGLQPDLVAITGDLVDGTVDQLRDQTAPLKDLRAKDGIFFVTGNHEYYTGDVDEWLAWLSGIGIRPLRNERVLIRDGFELAGTDDYSARGGNHRQDIPKALEGRNPEKPVVLMAHQPRSFAEAASLGVDLQLAGHTHGGQIYPFNYVVGLFQPYLRGLYRKGSSQIYVSCGTGTWGPPMRLGAPAEITEIELGRG
ncbi:MAG TPA: metallophosphoesterase, partial [bacterium]|nr:metallophosphoesterase [bacterium]